jgi:hypothetical protein
MNDKIIKLSKLKYSVGHFMWSRLLLSVLKPVPINPFDLYAGFQFWTKYCLQNNNSTYTRIDLYASIYGMFYLKYVNVSLKIW